MAVFEAPVEFVANALEPSTVLVATAPAPRPTVIELIVESLVLVKLKTLTARPAVKFATVTFVVALLWTIGNVSVPANGVVAEVSADILLLAIYLPTHPVLPVPLCLT